MWLLGIGIGTIFRDEFKALTIMTENVTEISLTKYQKTLLGQPELLKNLDNEIIELIDDYDEEDVDHINSEVDSSSKQTEDITEVLFETEN